VAKAIMAHYYLAEIHPFADGNGRTARALEALVLYVNGMNSYCFWSLANFWSTHRDQYILQLGNIRATCNPWDFLIWGIRGYLGEIRRIKGLILKKMKQLMFMDYVKYLLASKQEKDIKISQRVVDFLRLLVTAGRVPLEEFMRSPPIVVLYSKSSAATRSRDFKKMTQLGLVTISKDNAKSYIEPDFGILEALRYRV
jgi:cell filamentation protein, protein adenylyltransferase